MPMKQEWHTVNQSTGKVKVFDMHHIALQDISQEPAGTIITLEKHTTVITLESVYGTSENPLPPVPPKPISTTETGITHYHVKPS